MVDTGRSKRPEAGGANGIGNNMKGSPWRNYPSDDRKCKRRDGPKPDRKYIADKTAEYLRNGGEITRLPPQAAVSEITWKLSDFDWYL